MIVALTKKDSLPRFLAEIWGTIRWTLAGARNCG